jgi:hypothetical protein
VEASSGSPGAHINERMIADALIEAGLVTGRRLVGSDLRAWQQLWTYDEQTGSYQLARRVSTDTHLFSGCFPDEMPTQSGLGMLASDFS